jgi:hypothetical protein
MRGLFSASDPVISGRLNSIRVNASGIACWHLPPLSTTDDISSVNQGAVCRHRSSPIYLAEYNTTVLPKFSELIRICVRGEFVVGTPLQSSDGNAFDFKALSCGGHQIYYQAWGQPARKLGSTSILSATSQESVDASFCLRLGQQRVKFDVELELSSVSCGKTPKLGARPRERFWC